MKFHGSSVNCSTRFNWCFRHACAQQGRTVRREVEEKKWKTRKQRRPGASKTAFKGRSSGGWINEDQTFRCVQSKMSVIITRRIGDSNGRRRIRRHASRRAGAVLESPRSTCERSVLARRSNGTVLVPPPAPSSPPWFFQPSSAAVARGRADSQHHQPQLPGCRYLFFLASAVILRPSRLRRGPEGLSLTRAWRLRWREVQQTTGGWIFLTWRLHKR